MADTVIRLIRNGVAVGEHAPAAMFHDSIDTAGGRPAFNHVLSSIASNIASGVAQAKGLVVVAFSQNPEDYNFLHNKKTTELSSTWLQIVDCYTDPLGWENLLSLACEPHQNDEACIKSIHEQNRICSTVCRDPLDIDNLLTTIISIGKGSVNQQPNAQFVVAFDSIEILLRHQSLPLVARLLSTLRSIDQVSSLLWLMHSDLHERSIVASLEYIATMVISIEPVVGIPLDTLHNNVEIGSLSNLFVGSFRLRQKRRNGRVKEQVENFRVDSSSIKFMPVSQVSPIGMGKIASHKVPFNLQLTDKEVKDRAKVVLPFEHQGTGKEVKIYDGRDDSRGELMLQGKDEEKHLTLSAFTSSIEGQQHAREESKVQADSYQAHAGAIHYIRDSDDEFPDSDEDPDDDLDI
ncbi:hypothetical protein O6H91_12G003800 [Diphasiastrum complanatum]|uniref:Uncharacterized protein n=2 Tax=Diphasiastrum complanatum TaxID=34168 RepID=A0ACC2BYG7_DIPCM|nr:hypothetical protein O6H91_12G003800 [Diphasiastrum complanatum]KAJ7534799.1 hypothetical protein O6H91_12G003800 [Diphasiastrum complanatum]